MTKLDRELALGESLLNFAHLAHHVGADAEPEVFSRRDAAFLVAATAGLISSLVGLPQRMAQPVVEPQPPVAPPPLAKPAAPAVNNGDVLALAAYIAKVRENLAASRPRTFNSLRKAVDSWLGKKLDSKGLDALMEQLKKQKVVVEVDGKPTYPNFKK